MSKVSFILYKWSILQCCNFVKNTSKVNTKCFKIVCKMLKICFINVGKSYIVLYILKMFVLRTLFRTCYKCFNVCNIPTRFLFFYQILQPMSELDQHGFKIESILIWHIPWVSPFVRFLFFGGTNVTALGCSHQNMFAHPPVINKECHTL